MRRFAAMVLVLAACSMEFGGEDEGGDDKSQPPEPVSVVEVTPVVRGSVADELIASAVVEAEASADIIPEVSGRVTKVTADVGDEVDAGDVLAVVDNTTVDVGADRASAEVRHLEARYAELKTLAERGAVSEREVEDAAYQLRTARATLREARANYGETRLVAPFDGVVAARDVRVGQFTATGSRAFQVVDLSELRVVASLPERDLGRVRDGQTARLVSAYDSDRSAEASVTRIAPVVDATSGTFRVTLTLADDQDVLRPGQYVSVHLEVERREDVLTVPTSAVLYEGGRPFVFVMVEAPPEEEPETTDDEATDDAETTDDAEATDEAPEDTGPRWIAERRFVELGLTDVALAQIVKGVEMGERVVTIGHTSLREGARIREPKPEDATAEGSTEADGKDAG
jgi:membrane fusion protein (multidrug efflux system)